MCTRVKMFALTYINMFVHILRFNTHTHTPKQIGRANKCSLLRPKGKTRANELTKSAKFCIHKMLFVNLLQRIGGKNKVKFF